MILMNRWASHLSARVLVSDPSLDCTLTGWLHFIQNTETVNVQNEEQVDKQLSCKRVHHTQKL